MASPLKRFFEDCATAESAVLDRTRPWHHYLFRDKAGAAPHLRAYREPIERHAHARGVIHGDLNDDNLLLSEGRGCKRWPLRLPQRATLGLFEAKAAGCWVRRYTGPLTIAGVLPDGSRVAALA